MYIKLVGKDRSVLYTEIPQNPTISVFLDEDEEIWIAALMQAGIGIPGDGLVLTSGSLSECHECVNRILMELGTQITEIK